MGWQASRAAGTTGVWEGDLSHNWSLQLLVISAIKFTTPNVLEGTAPMTHQPRRVQHRASWVLRLQEIFLIYPLSLKISGK